MGHPPPTERPFPVNSLGEFIARERERYSFSRAQVAARVRAAARAEGVRDCRVNDRAVERWEKGESIPRPDNLRWLAAGLEVPVAQLAALARQGRAPVHQEEEEDTKRRGFVTGLAGVSLGGLDPGLLAAALGTPSRSDGRLLDDLEILTNEYGRLYWNMRPAVLWPTFYGHMAVTRRIHETAMPSLQRRAATVASQSASLLGMLAHRLDRRLDSIMYLTLADELAAEAGDGPLRAHALVALRAAYSPVTGPGRPNPARALQLTTEAINVAGADAPSMLRTWLHACRAEDHAVLGHAREADQDLEAADGALAQAEAWSGFFEHWDNARLAGFRGSCAVLLGQPDDAIPILESVARDTNPALVTPYTAVLTDLAGAYGQRGDIEHACATLDDVLTMARRVGMPERAGRVQRTRDARLAKWRDAPPVRRLDEHLREFVTSTEAAR